MASSSVLSELSCQIPHVRNDRRGGEARRCVGSWILFSDSSFDQLQQSAENILQTRLSRLCKTPKIQSSDILFCVCFARISLDLSVQLKPFTVWQNLKYVNALWPNLSISFVTRSHLIWWLTWAFESSSRRLHGQNEHGADEINAWLR